MVASSAFHSRADKARGCHDGEKFLRTFGSERIGGRPQSIRRHSQARGVRSQCGTTLSTGSLWRERGVFKEVPGNSLQGNLHILWQQPRTPTSRSFPCSPPSNMLSSHSPAPSIHRLSDVIEQLGPDQPPPPRLPVAPSTLDSTACGVFSSSPPGEPRQAGPNLATLPGLHPTLSTVCKFCRRGPWKMSDGLSLDYEPLPPGPSLPGAPTSPSLGGYTEQGAALVFVGLLLLLLVVLLVRCFRVLLDPYSRMPASSWTNHKEGLERGQFEYALV
ncbi:hypothetical protein AAFF_G00307200 [Aldrovandia affinis]|uniref:Cortexin 1 n=1 Tax=Aldrovandia affinis TaxID=143900 RepID=A0AAD7R8J3_9TELE|nr:hypothetical protein AAFF_G00307200 [Aldrovandia affinis]